MLTIILSEAQAYVALATAFSIVLTSLGRFVAVCLSWRQSRINGNAIQDLHDCLDKHDRDMRAYITQGAVVMSSEGKELK